MREREYYTYCYTAANNDDNMPRVKSIELEIHTSENDEGDILCSFGDKLIFELLIASFQYLN